MSGCIGALLLCACGRLGYELLDREDDGPPPADAGADRDAQSGAAGAGAGGGAAAGAGGRGSPPMDASVDGSTTSPDAAPPDAASDAQSVPTDAGDASDDAGDASDDAGADAGPNDAGQCSPATVTDYCTELPRLLAAPQIDGELDCGPPLLDLTPVAWTSMMSPLPAGFSARLAAAWHPDGVYFFIDVTDGTRLPPPAGTNVWCGDGVELYVDDDGTYAAAPMYDAPGSIQMLGVAPANDNDSVIGGGERYRSPNGGLIGPWSSTRHGAFPRPGGYTFEAFVGAEDLDLTSWTLVEGMAVGLDVAINVSTSADPPPPGENPGCGLRLGQYFLRVADPPCANACEPFINAAAFCNPMLLP